MRTVYTPARAKINLFLRITGKRDDGYHTLETVFHSVRLRDEIVMHFGRASGIEVRTDKRFLPADSRNIAHRAASAFFEKTGFNCPGVSINIKKRVPVGGGMGGGSADAAAVLRALNGYFGRPLSESVLSELGLSLGADVPFCLTGGAALAHGVGEKLKRVNALPDCFIVGCRPGISVSTKAAFELFDSWSNAQTDVPDASAMLDALDSGDLGRICDALYNDFEIPIIQKWPKLAEIKRQMLRSGARGALMTGSGAVVYGIFAGETDAKDCAQALEGAHSEIFITSPFVPRGR